MPESKSKLHKQAQGDYWEKEFTETKLLYGLDFFLRNCGAAYMIFQNILMTYAPYEPSCDAPTHTEQ